MKQIKYWLLAVAVSLSVTAIKAQTIDEVVNRHINALGGKDKLKLLKSVRMEGIAKTSGLPIDFTITKSHLVGQRIDLNIMNVIGYRINTPTAGWTFMPFEGSNSPKAMNEAQINAGIPNLDIQGPLFNYREKGNKLELLGKEKVDKTECYKIKVTLKPSKIFIYFINTKINLIYKSISPEDNNGVQGEVEIFYSNYKATANGYIFPYTIKNNLEEQIISKIEVNLPIDERIYSVN